jgi:sugar fermentation stimulation protein A
MLGRRVNQKGLYILVLHLENGRTIKVGRFGQVRFKPNYYAYVGSARGAGGIPARIQRHLRPTEEKRSHWHIDTLAQHAEIVEVWWSYIIEATECHCVKTIARFGRRPCPGFGASDCRCAGHLLEFENEQMFNQSFATLQEMLQGDLQRVRLSSTHEAPPKQIGEIFHAKENTNLNQRSFVGGSAQ